jgi:hypothetical protein
MCQDIYRAIWVKVNGSNPMAVRTGEVLGTNLAGQSTTYATFPGQLCRPFCHRPGHLTQYVPKADPFLVEWHAYDIPP